jgi:hypothetical protein
LKKLSNWHVRVMSHVSLPVARDGFIFHDDLNVMFSKYHCGMYVQERDHLAVVPAPNVIQPSVFKRKDAISKVDAPTFVTPIVSAKVLPWSEHDNGGCKIVYNARKCGTIVSISCDCVIIERQMSACAFRIVYLDPCDVSRCTSEWQSRTAHVVASRWIDMGGIVSDRVAIEYDRECVAVNALATRLHDYFSVAVGSSNVHHVHCVK